MRRVWMVIGLVVLAFGAMLLLARSQQGEWTSASRDALIELEKGLEAKMKFYDQEAVGHYERALEIDADFVAAKLALLQVVRQSEKRQKLAEELEAADLRNLTAREQFLVRHRLALHEGKSKEAKQILKAFLDAYPDDPWGLDAWAEYYWNEKNLEKASKVYRKLLAADPNWVLAQNRLGYVAMAQGRFEEAEELFRTYAYIAPDQANPHDSMGELLTVLGRYDEAVEQLETALSIKPDFCGSYEHLKEVEILRGRPEAVEPILQRAEAAGCGGAWIAFTRCGVEFWGDYMAGDYESPWREERAECAERMGSEYFLIHRMAALTGRFEVAEAAEANLKKAMRLEGVEETAEVKHWKGMILHLEGVRLLAEGNLEGAAERMEVADELFYYWGQDESILKLFNRLNLASAYDLAGDRARAREMLAAVAAVNPPFAGFYGSMLESFSS